MREPACPLVQGPYRLHAPIIIFPPQWIKFLKPISSFVSQQNIFAGNISKIIDYLQALHPQLAVDHHKYDMRSSHSLSPNQGI